MNGGDDDDTLRGGVDTDTCSGDGGINVLMGCEL